jgi:hypothetical protein
VTRKAHQLVIPKRRTHAHLESGLAVRRGKAGAVVVIARRAGRVVTQTGPLRRPLRELGLGAQPDGPALSPPRRVARQHLEPSGERLGSRSV